jgi:hypothetical protein
MCEESSLFFSGAGAAVPEVLAVDPDDVELVRQHLDLALEVHRGEPAVAQGTRQGVGRGRKLDAGVGQFTHQPGHQDCVARIVQLELINADQLVAAERIHCLTEGQGAHQVGVLNERAEGLGTRGGVPERGQQVGLAHAEAAVQVDPGAGLVLLAEQLLEQAAAVGRSHAVGETLECPDCGGLARLLGIRTVAGE